MADGKHANGIVTVVFRCHNCDRENTLSTLKIPEEVFQKIREDKKKAEEMLTKVPCLGYIDSKESVAMDPDKVQIIQQ